MQAIAQNGLTFTKDPVDRERYVALQGLAAEILAAGSTLDFSQALEIMRDGAGYATPKVDMRGVVFRGDTISAELGNKGKAEDAVSFYFFLLYTRT